MNTLFGEEEPRLRNAAVWTLLASALLLGLGRAFNTADMSPVAHALLLLAAFNLVASVVLWVYRAIRMRRNHKTHDTRSR